MGCGGSSTPSTGLFLFLCRSLPPSLSYPLSILPWGILDSFGRPASRADQRSVSASHSVGTSAPSSPKAASGTAVPAAWRRSSLQAEIQKHDFADMDLDHDNEVDFEEFCRMKRGEGLTETELRSMFDKLDLDKDGRLAQVRGRVKLSMKNRGKVY